LSLDLVTDHNGDQFNRHQITRLLARLRNAANIPTRITPTSCEPRWSPKPSKLAWNSGIVQDAAGHADSRTTRAYQRRSASLDKVPHLRPRRPLDQRPTGARDCGISIQCGWRCLRFRTM